VTIPGITIEDVEMKAIDADVFDVEVT